MRLMKRIGKPYTTRELAALVVSQEPSDSEAAERELFDLVCSDPETCAILDHFGTTRSDIEKLYSRLNGIGLSRWIGGSYVSAASIALKPTLIYLLSTINSPLPHGWSDMDLWTKIECDLVKYFRSGSLGAVSQ